MIGVRRYWLKLYTDKTWIEFIFFAVYFTSIRKKQKWLIALAQDNRRSHHPYLLQNMRELKTTTWKNKFSSPWSSVYIRIRQPEFLPLRELLPPRVYTVYTPAHTHTRGHSSSPSRLALIYIYMRVYTYISFGWKSVEAWGTHAPSKISQKVNRTDAWSEPCAIYRKIFMGLDGERESVANVLLIAQPPADVAAAAVGGGSWISLSSFFRASLPLIWTFDTASGCVGVMRRWCASRKRGNVWERAPMLFFLALSFSFGVRCVVKRSVDAGFMKIESFAVAGGDVGWVDISGRVTSAFWDDTRHDTIYYKSDL